MILVPTLRQIERSATSAAEVRLARHLQDIEGDAMDVAFHTVKLHSTRSKQQGEIDFVVLWRGTLIVVEVKGGGVRKHEGTWWSVDRFGDWNELKESPMEQANGGRYGLLDILKDHRLGWVPAESAVFTPDIEAPPPSVAWKDSHWWAKDTATTAGLRAALDVLAREAIARAPRAHVARPAALRDWLYGEFTRVTAVDAQRGAVLEEQVIATAGQARVLAGLAANQRILTYGGAGTGKSLILAEAAKQEAAFGRSVLITYRSPALTRFFKPLIDDWDIDLVPFEELAHGQKYDVVLVDEAQDLMNADGMDALDRTVKGGREHGRWRMFLDPNNQAHIGGEFDPEVHELVATEAMSFTLNKNVRNTRSIVHVVQEYLGADVGDPGIVHGEKVLWHQVDGMSDIAAGERVGRELTQEGVAKKDIWIIDVCSDLPPGPGRAGFVVTSPRYAKGLEAEHVVVCGIPREFDSRATAAFYVSVTRARVALHIVLSAVDRRTLRALAASRTAS